MKLISFCGGIICVLLISAVAANAWVCDLYEIPITQPPIIIYQQIIDPITGLLIYPPIDPHDEDSLSSWSFQARKTMNVELLYSILFLSYRSYSFELKHNNTVIDTWNRNYGSKYDRYYKYLSFNLKSGDSIILNAYGGTIWGGSIQFCGSPIISLADAILILKALTGITLNQEEMNQITDVNGDGKIGLEEVVYILQKVAGLR